MRRSGFIVRFVDVVLILLFGFISISSIRVTEVELPSSSEAPSAPPEREEVIFVAIRADGTYLVDAEGTELVGREALFDYLSDTVQRVGTAPVKVRVRTAYDAPMFYLMEVSQICEELGVAKAFEVRMAGGGA